MLPKISPHAPALEFSDRNTGRGHRGWEAGPEVHHLAEVQPGDVLLQLSRHGEETACNAIACLMGATVPRVWGQIAYFQFLIPSYAAGGFAIWDWELKPNARRLFRALKIGAHADREIGIFMDHLERFQSYKYGPPVLVPHRPAFPYKLGRIEALCPKG